MFSGQRTYVANKVELIAFTTLLITLHTVALLTPCKSPIAWYVVPVPSQRKVISSCCCTVREWLLFVSLSSIADNKFISKRNLSRFSLKRSLYSNVDSRNSYSRRGLNILFFLLRFHYRFHHWNRIKGSFCKEY